MTSPMTSPSGRTSRLPAQTDPELVARLLHAAGFGASGEQIEALAREPYENIVDAMVHPERSPDADVDLYDRYHTQRIDFLGQYARQRALFRMVTGQRPLQEKMTIFWHSLFANSLFKVADSPQMASYYEGLRDCALEPLPLVMLQVSQSPAMVHWLKQRPNQRDSLNIDYGRELLAALMLGQPGATDDDARACAQAFTGWTFDHTVPRYPWGPLIHKLEYRAAEHDDRPATLLGETGAFDSQVVLTRLAARPDTLRTIARELLRTSVSHDPEDGAIDFVTDLLRQTNGNTREVLRALFLSDFFVEQPHRRGKSPVEIVVEVARLSGEYADPMELHGYLEMGSAITAMGQDILAPSTDGSTAWVDAGSLLQRVNFAASGLGNAATPGIARIARRVLSPELSRVEDVIDACARELGYIVLRPGTRAALAEELQAGYQLDLANLTTKDVALVCQFIAASPEFQIV